MEGDFTNYRVVGEMAIFQQLAGCRVIRSPRVNHDSFTDVLLNATDYPRRPLLTVREFGVANPARSPTTKLAGIRRILTEQSLDCNKPPLG